MCFFLFIPFVFWQTKNSSVRLVSTSKHLPSPRPHRVHHSHGFWNPVPLVILARLPNIEGSCSRSQWCSYFANTGHLDKGARIFFEKNRWILHDQAQWVDSMRSIDLEPGLQYEEIPWCHWWMHNHFFVHEFSYQFLPIIFALQILTRKPLFGQETTESQRLGALLSSRKRLVKGIRKRALTRKQLLMGGKMVMSSHTQVMNGYSGSVHFQWQWNLLAKVQRSWTIFQVMMLLLNSSSP